MKHMYEEIKEELLKLKNIEIESQKEIKEHYESAINIMYRTALTFIEAYDALQNAEKDRNKTVRSLDHLDFMYDQYSEKVREQDLEEEDD